jgi:DNA-directed RNA polymerase subunit RPC12/RpoP
MNKMPVQDPDDVIGVCSECKSDQPMTYMYNSRFAQEGLAIPCKYCGGVVVITYRETRDESLDSSDRNRGIS